MLTLAKPQSLSQEIKKSRFLAICAPIADAEEARAFFAAHADPAATHNCWAFRTGPVSRFNDDGEPAGTAGRPILRAIDGQGLDHVAVLVIRWFGGILLGSGGLMRAYGGSAAMALQAADKMEHIATLRATLAAGFSDLARLKARLTALGATIAAEAFTGAGADLTLDIPETACPQALRLVADLTAGRTELLFKDHSRALQTD